MHAPQSECSTRGPWTSLFAPLAVVFASLVPARAYDTQTTAPYATINGPVKDNVEGSFVNLATFPIRPMVFVTGGSGYPSELWAVNHLNSTVEVFIGGGTSPIEPRIGVPWGPVSIAYWQGPDGTANTSDDEILVVCRGSWGVVRIDRDLREVIKVHQLRPTSTYIGAQVTSAEARVGRMAEPGDIVIDEATDMAFVSCSGADSVIQISLTATSQEIVRVFHQSFAPNDQAFRCKYPLFLTLEPSGTVLVAPMISGNNSMWGGALILPVPPATMGDVEGLHNGTTVLDLTDPAVCDPTATLPDEDLFRITPRVVGGTDGGVTVVAKGMGTLLFAHGLSPSGALWQLNTEAENEKSANQGEPSVTGKFAFNRISIIDPLPTSGTTSYSSIMNLDPVAMTGLSTGVAADQTAGQPFGLTFEQDTGNAFVTGLLTSNVLVINPAGNAVLAEFDLPAQSIPRQVVLRTVGSTRYAYVYCWGSNTIRVYRYWAGTPWTFNWLLTHNLSHDPSPDRVRAGRKLFYDGTNSSFHNLSCASCHVEAGSDMVVWNLSNRPLKVGGGTATLDDKGGMVTQTLVGLKRLGPFHWRGERTLAEFNEFAFPGLMGGTSLSAGQQQDFEAFLFSLANPANPNQNRKRLVDDAILPPHVTSADATQGLNDFFLKGTFAGSTFACADCHAAPTGTLNDIVNEFKASQRPRRSHLKVAPFTELWRKEQSKVTLKMVNGPASTVDVPRSFLGAGLSHTGEFDGLFDFIETIAPAIDEDNISAFVHQWDSGLAPAVHFTFFLNSSTTALVDDELIRFIKPQANPTIDPACDIVVVGKVYDPSQPSGFRSLRWYFDRDATPPPSGGVGAFLCEDPTVPDRNLLDFTQVGVGNAESHLFIGLPVGMGERFGVDYDMDGWYNLDTANGETSPLDPTIPTPGGPSPAIAVGYDPVVKMKTAKVARVQFKTNQPTTATVRYRRKKAGSSYSWHSARDLVYGKLHSIVIDGLQPSEPILEPAIEYEYEVTFQNRALMSATYPSAGSAPTFTTANSVRPTPTAFDPVNNLGHRQRLYEHMIESSSITPTVGTGYTDFHVAVKVAFRRGGDLDAPSGIPNPDDAAARIVIGHVLWRETSGLVTTPAIDLGGSTTAKAFTSVRCGLVLPTDDDPSQPGLQFPSSYQGSKKLEVDGGAGGTGGSSFLVSVTPTGVNGEAVLDFRVADVLAAGEEILFVVDTVVELDPTRFGTTGNGDWEAALTSTTGELLIPSKLSAPSGDNGRDAFTQWSFPDGMEKRAAPKYPPYP